VFPGLGSLWYNVLMPARKQPEEIPYATAHSWDWYPAYREKMLAERGPLPAEEPGVWMPAMMGPGEPWSCYVRYVLRNGRAVIRDLRIEVTGLEAPWDIPASGLTHEMLRRVRLRPTAASRAEIQRGLGEGVSVSHVGVPEVLAAIAFTRAGLDVIPKVVFSPHERHERISDEQAAQWANDYLVAVSKDPQRPRAWLADEYQRLGEVGVNLSEMVKDRIRQAERHGFLTKAAGQGDRNPREPTDKLRQWNKARTKKKGRTK
jgi:hypothetical protein